MTGIAEFFYLIIIRPLELLFECIFALADRIINNPGITLIVLSLVVSLCALPLYLRADRLSQEHNDKMKTLDPHIRHIKKVFKGDERVMMLSALYKVSGYHAAGSLQGSLPLLLQIPFFISMYRMISSLASLKGVPFLFIRDLSLPDASFHIGSFPVNILPILMTVINITSALIYEKKGSGKRQWQAYILALFFLVLLYTCPAGLVLYWTCNNIFSLIKNAVQVRLEKISGKNREPAVRRNAPERKRDKSLILSGLFLASFVGAYIPSTVIAASPQEFTDLIALTYPTGYLRTSFLIAVGFFVVWPCIYYFLVGGRAKIIISCIINAGVFISLIDFFLFEGNHGNMNSVLGYINPPEYSGTFMLLNLLAVSVAAAVAVVISVKKIGLMPYAAAAGILFAIVTVTLNIVYSNIISEELLKPRDSEEVSIGLSTEDRNVVVIMLDCALNQEIPYIMQERPELLEQFDGFTYYPNTVSTGCFTNFGVPGVYGGYDYTTESMNRRDDIPLAEKHNEALHLMPRLFMENGYDAYFINPTYAGYSWIPDLSAFDDLPGIHTGLTLSKYNEYREEQYTEQDHARNRNFFFYSLFKTAPVFLRDLIYNNGLYNEPVSENSGEITVPQVIADDYLTATGHDTSFDDAYSVLDHLDLMTEISDKPRGSVIIMSNDTTHEGILLQLPDYVPAQNVDNTAYPENVADRELDGRIMHMNGNAPQYYHRNISAMLRLGEWFDYLRANGVYDNTRIILVADHGIAVHQFDDMMFESPSGGRNFDVMFVNPLLMVKDFDAEGFSVDNSFMTNADTPALAMQGLIEDPVNPYTGNPVNMDPKDQDVVRIIFSADTDILTNNGNTYTPGRWFSVTEDIFNEDNWEYLGEY